MCLKEWESFIRTHHFWWCKGLDRVILEPSISQEVFWTSLSCSHLHRFVSSTQSLTLWFGCHGQQEHYGKQGLCEQDCFRRDDSNFKKEGEKMIISTIILQLQAITAWTGMGEGEKITGKKLKEKYWTELIWTADSRLYETCQICFDQLKLIWHSNEKNQIILHLEN